MFAALALLLLGVGVSWWAPPATTDPPAYLKATFDGTAACGEVLSADGGLLRLSVAGRHDPVVIPLSRLTNLAVVPGCG